MTNELIDQTVPNSTTAEAAPADTDTAINAQAAPAQPQAPVTPPAAADASDGITFAKLNLAEPILRAVTDAGYVKPTPIQAQAIPVVLQGGDLMAGAQTGTGKTAGFTLPMLQRLSEMPPKKDARGRTCIRALILTPTRELAAQVTETMLRSALCLPQRIKVVSAIGGVSINPQMMALRGGAEVVVAGVRAICTDIGRAVLQARKHHAQ